LGRLLTLEEGKPLGGLRLHFEIGGAVDEETGRRI